MNFNIGELVNNAYNRDDIISIISESMRSLSTTLSSAVQEENWGAVGSVQAQLAQLAMIAKSLDEKVNGKKEATVI